MLQDLGKEQAGKMLRDDVVNEQSMEEKVWLAFSISVMTRERRHLVTSCSPHIATHQESGQVLNAQASPV